MQEVGANLKYPKTHFELAYLQTRGTLKKIREREEPECKKPHLRPVPDEIQPPEARETNTPASNADENRDSMGRRNRISVEIQQQVRLLKDSAHVITSSPAHPPFEDPEIHDPEEPKPSSKIQSPSYQALAPFIEP